MRWRKSLRRNTIVIPPPATVLWHVGSLTAGYRPRDDLANQDEDRKTLFRNRGDYGLLHVNNRVVFLYDCINKTEGLCLREQQGWFLLIRQRDYVSENNSAGPQWTWYSMDFLLPKMQHHSTSLTILLTSPQWTWYSILFYFISALLSIPLTKWPRIDEMIEVMSSYRARGTFPKELHDCYPCLN